MNEDKKRYLQPISEIVGEMTLDSQLADGFLKEIPIVKSIWSMYNAGKSLQEHFYLRKLKIFLENIKDLNENDYHEFLKDTENNKEKLTDSILLILDKIENETKSIIIANAFKLYIKERFSRETFDRILLIISRGYCTDLLRIIAFENHDKILTNNKYLETESLQELFSCGLLYNNGIDGGSFDSDDGGTIYSLNKYGEIFLRIVKPIKASD